MAQCIGVLYELNPMQFDCSRGPECEVAELIEGLEQGDEALAQEIRDAHAERVPPDEVTAPHT